MPLRIFLFLVLFLSGCSNVSAPTESDDTTLFYRTTPPAQLFFKNMRSVYYESLSAPEGMDYYRYRKLSQRLPANAPIPIIVDHWLADRAYLVFQTNDAASSSNNSSWIIRLADDDEFVLTGAESPNRQTDLGIRLVEALQNNQNVIWNPVDGESAVWLPTTIDQEFFRQVINDYQRLIE